LVDFKKEIEEKFAKSKLRTFKFPLKKPPKLPDAMRNTRYAGLNNSENLGEREAAPPINSNTNRRYINQSSFVNYQNDQLYALD